ncbi:Aerobic cobaltochelatase subunit CobN [Thalassocella blandensis]|nr:Aerobic cobaltochelatase subunit CobN [Thalassocella blandensis]
MRIKSTLKYIVLLSLFPLLSIALAAAGSDSADQQSILFVTGSHSNKSKISLFDQYASKQGIGVTIISSRELDDLTAASQKFENFDAVFFSGVSVRDSQRSFAKYSDVVQQSDRIYVALSWPQEKSLNKGVGQDALSSIVSYYDNGGEQNFNRLAQFMKNRVFQENRDIVVPPPMVYPEIGIYHPDFDDKVFESLDKYLAWKHEAAEKNKAAIGVMFTRNLIESADTHVIDNTIRLLESKGVLPVPFFSALSPASPSYVQLLQKDDQTFVDAILNFRNIHWASARKSEFESLGVPVMQALIYYDGNQAAWESNNIGISPNMTPFQLVLPEAAGVIDPWIVGAVDEATDRTQIIDYQLQHLVDKSIKVANLKHKPRQDKRVSVMVWGNRDVGASFMNVPESIRSIANRLGKEGYSIPEINSEYITNRVDDILNPFYRSYELERLIDKDLAELMPVDEYLSWFSLLPESVRMPINEYWGEAKDNFMVIEYDGKQQFVIPRIRIGNMLVLRQPPRADNDDDDKRIYHKGTVPMNHYYLAAYYYVRTYFNSDAIVHLGTHGSHEYLPGKERGLSLYDQGNLAAWDTPIVYPFIVDDVGEAMQTKRRGRATVISHMTPPFAAAGLQGEIANLHELMHQYKSLDAGGVKQKTADQIVSVCQAEDICTDIGWEAARIEADFSMFMEELHVYLEELATQNQPLGLHTFGELAEPRLLTATLVQMLGREYVTLAADWEAKILASEHSFPTEQREKEDILHTANHDAENALESIVGFATIKEYVTEFNKTKVESDSPRSDEKLPKDLLDKITEARELYQNMIGIQELDNLVRALDGQYIPVKTGGDPIRHPDSLPTGLNLYGFDPSRVPTKAAYEQGKELTENAIAEYYKEHGQYPDKLAFSLWSMETMRHYGVLESQVLSAIGVRPTWSPDGRVIGSEIIPMEELKRPRVDVVLSATGLYRDAFPNVMQWLAKAIEKIAQLKEANNSIWDNAQRVKNELVDGGIEEEEARYLSTVRIFSNASGNYGSGLGDAAMASDTWETDEKLADLYLDRMGYFYGADDSRWGKKIEGDINLYSKQLSGTDMVMFSRSSNVFGLLSSDDPFQYFGGLALAVRNLDGKSPEMMISNLRDAKNAKMENAAKFMAKELRSRAFHQRWVEEMKKEGYSGAVAMASTLANFFGWQVMDPNLVRGDQWQEFYEVYVQDKFELDMNSWFEEVDPKAQQAMIEHMLEANRKAYWQASEEALKTLIKRYQELVNRHDLVVENEKLKEFMSQKASGFGVDFQLPELEPAAFAKDIAKNSVDKQQVEGQKLERVEPESMENSSEKWLILSAAFLCCFFVVLGAWRQQRFSMEKYAGI